MATGTVEGSIAGTKIRLATWTDEQPYRRRYVPVDPETGVVGGDDSRFSIVPGTQLWHISKWSSGEDPDAPWDETSGSYDIGVGARPTTRGEGVELAAQPSVTDNSVGSDFNDGARFGYGLGKLWTAKGNTAYSWDTATNRWAAGTTITTDGSLVASLSSDGDTYMFSGHDLWGGHTIRRWAAGVGHEQWYANAATDPFSWAPILRSWGGILYALDGDDLYEIDQTTADTRTLLADLTGSSSGYLADTPWCYNRMSFSDVGPVWVQRLDNGQTFIWEYNVASDTVARIGKLPVDFATPYSVYYTVGFIFIGFRYASDHYADGDAYLYFQRGAQRGLAGPFRNPAGSSATLPVWIAGQIGSELLIYFDGAIWAYDLDAGGISMAGLQTTIGQPVDAVTFGKDIFIADVTSGDDTDAVERFNTTAYATSGYVNTGRYDMRYLGLPKILLEVSVVTDPLPAGASVNMSYSADGAAYQSLTGTHDTDGAATYTWLASTSSATITGREFAFQATLAGNGTTTPTIRTVTSTATGAAHQREWVLAIDCTTDKSGSADSSKVLDALNTLAATEEVVAFVDPWQNRDSDSSDTFDVTVEEVFLPQAQSDSRQFAQVRLRGSVLVVP